MDQTLENLTETAENQLCDDEVSLNDGALGPWAKKLNDKLLQIDGTKFLGVQEVTIVDDVKVGSVTLNSPEHLNTRLVAGS